jgi:tol-pal system protein YbgF
MFRCVPWVSTTRWLRCCAVLIVVAAPAIARAQMQPQDQDRTTEDRLDRIERDLNMLQRQVYRAAPGVMAAPGAAAAPGGSTAANLEVRMEQVEAQMRDLTGKVEELTNGLDQLKQRIEQINSDFSVRFDQMSGGNGAVASAPPPPRPSAGSARIAAGPPPPAPGTVVPPPLGDGLNPVFGTLSPPGTVPSRPSPPFAPETASTDSSMASGSTTEQFNHAFGLLKQSDYAGAETALKTFIDAHPNDPLAGNAQYWLGQTYFARNKYSEAAGAFADSYKRFPKGPKAADNLLYLSMSLAKSDQKKNACLALEQLDQAFPNPALAIRQRAAAEKKRIGCG